MRRILAGLVLLAALPAAAQQAQPPIFNLTDDQIRQIMQATRDKLHLAKLPDGGTVKEETDAEKAQPLITADAGRKVIEAGLLAGVGTKCGVDLGGLQKVVTNEKATVKANVKANAYIELLHGAGMGTAQAQTKECTPQLKERVALDIKERVK